MSVDKPFIFMIIVGILLLTVSIKPTIQVCKKTNRFAWSLLLILIVLFIFGYCWVLYYFTFYGGEPFVATSVSFILVGGGTFVYLVVRLSLKSILELERSAQHQQFLAEHDSLTNLPKRKKFFNVLNENIEYNQPR